MPLSEPWRTMIRRTPAALVQSRPARRAAICTAPASSTAEGPTRLATTTSEAAPAPSNSSPRVMRPSASVVSDRSETAWPARAGVAISRAARAGTNAFIGLRPQVRRGLEHLVGRGDDLGVHLVGALGDDQGGDFADRVD